jgi:hypothetical protein
MCRGQSTGVEQAQQERCRATTSVAAKCVICQFRLLPAILAPDERWATSLARTLGVPKATLEHWIRCGWVHARQEPTGLRRWIVWADAAEQERLRQFHHRPTRDEAREHWLQQREMHHAPTS